MADSFAGQHVVITGGDGALGQAVVRALRDAGATCHLPLFGPAAPPAAAGVAAAPGIDLSDEGAVTAYYAALPPITASIHLAGGFASRAFVDTTRADLEAQLTMNFITAFLCCREAVRAMRKGGGGRIVNVAARVVELPTAGMTAYVVAKSAVAALTRAVADEVRNDGILVNAVLPSIIDTPANRKAMPNADVARWPRPEDVARTIRWLASAENTLTSGALVPVYGRS